MKLDDLISQPILLALCYTRYTYSEKGNILLNFLYVSKSKKVYPRCFLILSYQSIRYVVLSFNAFKVEGYVNVKNTESGLNST